MKPLNALYIGRCILIIPPAFCTPSLRAIAAQLNTQFVLHGAPVQVFPEMDEKLSVFRRRHDLHLEEELLALS